MSIKFNIDDMVDDVYVIHKKNSRKVHFTTHIPHPSILRLTDTDIHCNNVSKYESDGETERDTFESCTNCLQVIIPPKWIKMMP